MGKKVFDGGDTFAISYAHVHEPVPELPEEKAGYQSLLNKLLAKNPDDRFQNTTQLISQLKKYLRRLKPMNDTTHSFAPLPDMARHKKKSSPMPFIITGVLIVVAVLLGIWFMNQQNSQIDVNLAELTATQKVEMSQKLAAANSFFNMENFDVAIVIGANDVVNPAARELKGSPIYGMPVINADLAKNVFVIKRSMSSGFAGVDNPLFFKDNTRMIFGDAKEVLNHIVRQFTD